MCYIILFTNINLINVYIYIYIKKMLVIYICHKVDIYLLFISIKLYLIYIYMKTRVIFIRK